MLPFALDRGVVVAARRRGDDVLDIRSHQADGPVTVSLATLRAGSVTGWAHVVPAQPLSSKSAAAEPQVMAWYIALPS